MSKKNSGLKIQGAIIKIITFADDIATLVEEKKDLESDQNRMDKIMYAKEMKFNKNETKIMVISSNKNINL